MTLDNLKAKWQDAKMTSAERDVEMRCLASEIDVLARSRSAAERLAGGYLRKGILLLFLGVFCIISLAKNFHLHEYTLWIYGITFLFAFICNMISWHRVSHAKIYDLPVVDAQREVISLRRLIYRLRIANIFFAIPCLVTLFMDFANESDSMVLWSAVIGAVVGLVLAGLICSRTRRQFREMIAPFTRESE